MEISVSESLGVENRGAYYEKSGALRDMVQNHLLNLAAFVAMECPSSFGAESIRDEVAKVLECLRPMDAKAIDSGTVRGQYAASGGMAAYRSEKNVAADSLTETFAALKFHIENWRWGGVPFYLYTGKRLSERKSEVVINFKSAPVQMFVGQCSGRSCNKLTLRIQPDEGVWLKFGLKVPGAGYEVAQVSMDSSISGANLPDAYERLLLDAMSGDATLYARSDALEAGWKFIDPILARWAERGADGLEFYAAGSDGPEGARKMRLEHSSEGCPIRFSANAKGGDESRKECRRGRRGCRARGQDCGACGIGFRRLLHSVFGRGEREVALSGARAQAAGFFALQNIFCGREVRVPRLARQQLPMGARAVFGAFENPRRQGVQAAR